MAPGATIGFKLCLYESNEGILSPKHPCQCQHLHKWLLTLKALIRTAADDIHKYFSCFSEKIRLDVSSESSARQRIHMKNQI